MWPPTFWANLFFSGLLQSQFLLCFSSFLGFWEIKEREKLFFRKVHLFCFFWSVCYFGGLLFSQKTKTGHVPAVLEGFGRLFLPESLFPSSLFVFFFFFFFLLLFSTLLKFHLCLMPFLHQPRFKKPRFLHLSFLNIHLLFCLCLSWCLLLSFKNLP